MPSFGRISSEEKWATKSISNLTADQGRVLRQGNTNSVSDRLNKEWSDHKFNWGRMERAKSTYKPNREITGRIGSISDAAFSLINRNIAANDSVSKIHHEQKQPEEISFD